MGQSVLPEPADELCQSLRGMPVRQVALISNGLARMSTMVLLGCQPWSCSHINEATMATLGGRGATVEVAPRFPRSGSGFPRVPRAGFLAHGFRHFHVLVLARPRFGLTSTQAASGFGCGSGCGNFGGIGSAFSALRWNGSAFPLAWGPNPPRRGQSIFKKYQQVVQQLPVAIVGLQNCERKLRLRGRAPPLVANTIIITS